MLKICAYLVCTLCMYSIYKYDSWRNRNLSVSSQRLLSPCDLHLQIVLFKAIECQCHCHKKQQGYEVEEDLSDGRWPWFDHCAASQLSTALVDELTQSLHPQVAAWYWYNVQKGLIKHSRLWNQNGEYLDNCSWSLTIVAPFVSSSMVRQESSPSFRCKVRVSDWYWALLSSYWAVTDDKSYNIQILMILRCR
jgi:hypothetical protein